MVRTSGYRYLKLVHGYSCSKLLAESAEMRWTYIIHHAIDMQSGGSETEMTQRFWIQIIIHRNGILAARKDCLHFMYNCSAPNDCWYVPKVSSMMSVHGVSTIYSLTHSEIKRLHSRIHPNKKLWPSQKVK